MNRSSDELFVMWIWNEFCFDEANPGNLTGFKIWMEQKQMKEDVGFLFFFYLFLHNVFTLFSPEFWSDFGLNSKKIEFKIRME